MSLRKSTSSMMRCPQKNKRMSSKTPKKDIYHTSSSERAANNTTNWKPIFRITSQQAMNAWPRNVRQPSVSWTSTTRIQWWSNPNLKEWHFLKKAIVTRTYMNTTIRSSVQTRSAITAARKVAQHPISETIPRRLPIIRRMKKSQQPAGQSNPAGQKSQR